LAGACQGKAFPGPGGSLRLDSRTFGKTEFIPLLDLAEALGLKMRWFYEPRKMELRNHAIALDLMVGSRLVQIDKCDVRRMNAAVVFSKGEPYVPASFLTATLKPYYRRLGGSGKAGGRGSGVVVIDPGHGGKDTGAISSRGATEKELVLDISRRVRTILTRKGIKVRMTRDSDKPVGLVHRSDIANKIGASIFVSIHANSVRRNKRSISGSETFYLSKAQSASAKRTERIENSPVKNEVNSRWSSLTYRVKRWFLGKHFKQTREKSRKLAQAVQRRLARVAIGKDRGIKRANFSVLRNVYCPSCLVEVGFMSNPTDATYLRRSSYRQKIAEAIAQGITEYLNSR